MYGRCEKRAKVRVVAEEKYDIIRELLDTNMVFRILHNNLDEMVAESIHKVSLLVSQTTIDALDSQSHKLKGQNCLEVFTIAMQLLVVDLEKKCHL